MNFYNVYGLMRKGPQYIYIYIFNVNRMILNSFHQLPSTVYFSLFIETKSNDYERKT